MLVIIEQYFALTTLKPQIFNMASLVRFTGVQLQGNLQTNYVIIPFTYCLQHCHLLFIISNKKAVGTTLLAYLLWLNLSGRCSLKQCFALLEVTSGLVK